MLRYSRRHPVAGEGRGGTDIFTAIMIWSKVLLLRTTSCQLFVFVEHFSIIVIQCIKLLYSKVSLRKTNYSRTGAGTVVLCIVLLLVHIKIVIDGH